jgi:membrane protein
VNAGVTEPDDSARARIARYARVTRRRADELRDEATARIDRLEAERADHPLSDIVFCVREEDERVAGRELAAALAYRFFFLMLPVALVLVGGLGLAGSASADTAADAVRESGASAAVAHDIAEATAELSLFEHLVVLVIGISGTFWAVRGLLKTLTRVNAVAFSMKPHKPTGTLRVMAIVLGLLVVLLMFSSAWGTMRTQLGVAEFLLALPVVGIVYAIVIVALHAHVPRPDDVTWRDLIPGGLLIGISLAAMQALVLGYIAERLSNSNALYGGVGTAVVLLFWLYLLGRMFVLGPVLDAVLWHRAEPDRATRSPRVRSSRARSGGTSPARTRRR